MNAKGLSGNPSYRRWMRIFAFIGFCASFASEGRAADIDFMGVDVTPAPGRYLVENDVNVREKPSTSGKRLGGLDKGEIVQAVGKAPGTVWLAVLRDGKPFGFVYGTVLSPIVDGEIKEDVTGEVQVADVHRCGFRIHFIDRPANDDEPVPVSDYDTTIVCERGNKRIRFPAQMFMTEVPFDGSNKRRVFQINVDLLDIRTELHDVFSTITLFDLDKGEVRFDSVTDDKYGRSDAGLSALPATDVPRALASAVELALMHWSDKAWNDIFKNAR